MEDIHKAAWLVYLLTLFAMGCVSSTSCSITVTDVPLKTFEFEQQCTEGRISVAPVMLHWYMVD